MKTNIINLNLKSKKLNVYIGDGIFSDIIGLMEENNLSKQVFALIDKSVFKHHKEKILSTFKDFEKFDYIIFESREKNKTIETILKIYNEILKKKHSRNSTFIAIGGGIVGDLFGFVAATFMRGVNYIQVPTTVLACVDSSVGGKTGFNFESYKNIIGSIYQPAFVLIDTHFLTTLKQNQVINGIGEIVKTCFLISHKQVEKFEQSVDKLISLDNEVMTDFIVECVKFKAGVVTADEKETLGMRKILNLGHTFAHAIEKETDFKTQHGEAVIIGMVCSLYLSYELNLINEELLTSSLYTLNTLFPYISIPDFDIEKAYSAMKQDKKSVQNHIKFVLVQDYGKTLIDVEADKKDVIFAFNQGIEFFKKDQ